MKNIYLIVALIALAGVIIFFICKRISVGKEPVTSVKGEMIEEVSDFMDIIIKKDAEKDSVCCSSAKDSEECELPVEEQMIKNLEFLYRRLIIFHDIIDKLVHDDFIRFALVVCYLKNHATDEDIENICKYRIFKLTDFSLFRNFDDRNKRFRECISELYEFLLLDCNKKKSIKKRLNESGYLKAILNDNIKLDTGSNYKDLVEKIAKKYKNYEIILKKKKPNILDGLDDVFLTSSIIYYIYYNV